MRRGLDRQQRPPRVGGVMLAKALAGVLLIFVVAGAGTAGAGYFQFDKLFPPADAPLPGGGKAPPALSVPELPEVEPGGPRTLLLLGSDHRAKTSIDARLGADKPLSDTIVLVRLDPKKKRVAVLSLPRDLAVTIPGVGEGIKINEAYTDGGARKTLATVKLLFRNATGKDFPINSVIDVDFNGFQRAVDYVGGVYVDVDRRYYNPPNSGYAAINVEPGYQKLDGKDALAYVRYRHTDSDLFRNARQQDFLRQAADQPAVRHLKSLSQAAHLVQIMRRYFRFDKQFLKRRNIAGLLKTALYLALGHAPINQIKLPGITESSDPENDTRLFVSPENIARAYQEFMTGRGATNPKQRTTARHVKHRASGAKVSGLADATGSGQSVAAPAARRLSFPFYFPAYLTTGGQYVSDTPRVYRIRDLNGVRHQAYRLVVAAGSPGEYYGVEGMTWRTPPILDQPDRVRIQNGRKLLLFYDGRHLRMIGWRTRHAAYWVTNTLDRKLSNQQLLAVTLSLRRRHQ
jgi:LCP family protein required for cell wall assembly